MLVHPHTYRDVVNIHNLQDLDGGYGEGGDTTITNNYSGKMRIIGFKNMTQHAGATTLIYLLRKALSGNKVVGAIEVNKVDFLYFNDKELVSTTTSELPKELMKKQLCDIVLVDLNDYDDVSICSQVYYLIEPSTIMINKMLRKNKSVLETLKNEKVVLNKCVLNSEDVATFEYETNDENLVDSSIEVYITAEPLEKFEGLLPTIEEADEGNVYSIYDNILYYMENDDNMSLFKTNICTVVFDGSKYSYFCGVIDGEKESYINKYCNVLYNFFQQMYK